VLKIFVYFISTNFVLDLCELDNFRQFLWNFEINYSLKHFFEFFFPNFFFPIFFIPNNFLLKISTQTRKLTHITDSFISENWQGQPAHKLLHIIKLFIIDLIVAGLNDFLSNSCFDKV